VQVAELTKIIEESELFKYPEQDDFIGTVGNPRVFLFHPLVPYLLVKIFVRFFQPPSAQVGPSRFRELMSYIPPHSFFPSLLQLKYDHLLSADGGQAASKKRKIDETQSPRKAGKSVCAFP
jgi:hypothetical protein